MRPSRQETRGVAPFRRLVLQDHSGGAEVIVEQGPAESLRIEGGPEHLARIETGVLDETLYVRLGGSWLERLGDRLSTSLARPNIIYRLQVRDIESLDLSCPSAVTIGPLKAKDLSLSLCSAGRVVAKGVVADHLTLEHDGVGQLIFHGRVGRQVVRLGGAGVYSALDLRSEHAAISVSGSARAVVNVATSLEATVRGMGTIEFLGRPHVCKQVFGLGAVSPLG